MQLNNNKSQIHRRYHAPNIDLGMLILNITSGGKLAAIWDGIYEADAQRYSCSWLISLAHLARGGK